MATLRTDYADQTGTDTTTGDTWNAAAVNAQNTQINANTAAVAAVTPPSGVTLRWEFVFTSASAVRPTVPANVVLDWKGPVQPTNMPSTDYWINTGS